ncbi:MAG: hypothetical protein ACRDA5_01215 [Clostridium sp.]
MIKYSRKLRILVLVVGILLLSSGLVSLLNNKSKLSIYGICLGLWYIIISLTFAYKE